MAVIGKHPRLLVMFAATKTVRLGQLEKPSPIPLPVRKEKHMELREQIIKIIKDAFTGKTKDGKVWCKPVDGVPEKIADTILTLMHKG